MMHMSTSTSDKLRIRLKFLMQERGVTYADLIRRDSSIRQSTISDFMTGRNKTMTVDTLEKLCRAMDVSLEEFFGGEMFG